MAATAQKKPIDKFIPWLFVIFFMALALLDGFFVTLAVRTHTGTVTENAYEKGLAYNEALAGAAMNDALGWKADIHYAQGRLTAALSDKEGRAIEGAQVSAKLVRPVQDGYDFEAELQPDGKGVYSAPVTLALRGQWTVRILATWQDRHYQYSKTIIAP